MIRPEHHTNQFHPAARLLNCHAIVVGDFEVILYTTRLMTRASLTMHVLFSERRRSIMRA